MKHFVRVSNAVFKKICQKAEKTTGHSQPECRSVLKTPDYQTMNGNRQNYCYG